MEKLLQSHTGSFLKWDQFSASLPFVSVVYFSLLLLFPIFQLWWQTHNSLYSVCPSTSRFCEIPFALPSASFHSINSSLICVLVSMCGGGEREDYYCYFTACPSNCRLVGRIEFLFEQNFLFRITLSDDEFLALRLNHQSAKDELIGSRNRLLLQPPHIVFCSDVWSSFLSSVPPHK